VSFNPEDIPFRNVRIVKPYPITHRFTPNVDFVGNTLLYMMSIKFPFQPKEVWQDRIRSGRVYIENRATDVTTILKMDDEIRHHNPAVIEPSIPDEVRIIDETKDYIAVFKPAPMPMHPGGRYYKNSLTYILEEIGYANVKITHRLDAVTSGVVLFAKNKAFSKKVMEAFIFGNVQKHYQALVLGVPDEKTKTIQSKIRRKKGFVFESGSELTSGQNSITEFEVLETYQDVSLIKCQPLTGRTHQIRLHLAEWGYPIIDDPIYGFNGNTNGKRTQNMGISLRSKVLKIPSLGVDIRC
jgi:RluA family pseudouridine synthase